MRLSRTIALYFSPTHTTERAVKAFAAGTGLPYEAIDLTTPAQRKGFKRAFRPDELVVAGFPVYGGLIPKGLEDFFTGLEGRGASAVAVVVYGNRDYDDALIELKNRLEERGLKVRAAATFIGEHTISSKIATGRPDDGDLEIAADFARRTIASITADGACLLALKGSYPYVSKGSPPRPGPVTSEACTLCGICVELCPWEAIDGDDCKTVDSSKCLGCARCVRECPEGAKSFVRDEAGLARVADFEKRLTAKRCEPELFLPQEA